MAETMAEPQPTELGVEAALAGIAWRRDGWALMVVTAAGDVSTRTGYSERDAYKILQRTAQLTTTEVWIDDRFVTVVDVSKAPRIPKSPTSRSIPPRLRFDVLTRDAFRCRYCGAAAPDVQLHVDHRVSVKDGGTDDLTNLVTACQDCNLGKGSRSA